MLDKLKSFRKAFITNFIKIHYSQFGEDIILKELIKPDYIKGFYVDVGCYHPKKHSNTYMLYRKGWRGINIDMEVEKINLFNMVRPQDHNVVSAVSDKVENATLHKFNDFGLGSTIDQETADTTKQTAIELMTVETRRLNDIIESSPYKGKQIDVLSIDVEGMDYKVLTSLDFETYSPQIIIIESHVKTLKDVLKTDIYKFLEERSYLLRSWTFFSLIFYKPNSPILKKRETKAV